MKAPAIIALLVISSFHTSSLRAEPDKDRDKGEKAVKVVNFGEEQFRIASLLHRIYETSLQEEKIARELAAKKGGKEKEGEGDKKAEPSIHQKMPTINNRNFVKSLGDLINLKQFKKRLSKDLKQLKDRGLGPKHPDRRWIEALLRAIEKHGPPAK